MKAVKISSLWTKMKAYFDGVSDTSHLMSTKENRKRLEQSIENLRKGNTKLFSLNEDGNVRG